MSHKLPFGSLLLFACVAPPIADTLPSRSLSGLDSPLPTEAARVKRCVRLIAWQSVCALKIDGLRRMTPPSSCSSLAKKTRLESVQGSPARSFPCRFSYLCWNLTRGKLRAGDVVPCWRQPIRMPTPQLLLAPGLKGSP